MGYTADEIEKRAREMQRDYKRRWRAQNPGKDREYNRQSWLRKATADLERKSVQVKAAGRLLSDG